MFDVVFSRKAPGGIPPRPAKPVVPVQVRQTGISPVVEVTKRDSMHPLILLIFM